MKKINNKILNKIVAKLFVEYYDKYLVDIVEKNGFYLYELSTWIKAMFSNFLFDIYENSPVLEWFYVNYVK